MRVWRAQACGARLQAKAVHNHREHTCPRRTVLCSNDNCWKKIRADKREQHEVFECRYSQQWCPLGCKTYVQRSLLRVHVEKKCPERTAVCQHCGEDVKAGNLQAHETTGCWLRPRKKSRELTEEEQEKLRWKQLRAMKAAQRSSRNVQRRAIQNN